jgi:hypothetical protein
MLSIKSKLSRALVRWASRSISASYEAYVRVDKGQMPNWWMKPWDWLARRVNQVAIPSARKLDKDAMVEEMAKQGWWG